MLQAYNIFPGCIIYLYDGDIIINEYKSQYGIDFYMEFSRVKDLTKRCPLFSVQTFRKFLGTNQSERKL